MEFETSVPGIFAAGDVRHASTKRVASAVGEGAGAVQHVHEHLEERRKIAVDAPITSGIPANSMPDVVAPSSVAP
jgi:pyruvate/2-oxoglutarate dehydrogenase complex dihydrolipoamide dehydrogenase (E3) component